MTVLEVICKTVAIQNNSQWLCSMCYPPAQTCGGEDIQYIYFSNISWTPWVLDPTTNPHLGTPTWLHPVTERDLLMRPINNWLPLPIGIQFQHSVAIQKPYEYNSLISNLKSSKLSLKENDLLIA